MIHVDILKAELTDELVPIDFTIEFTVPKWAEGIISEPKRKQGTTPVSPLYFTKKQIRKMNAGEPMSKIIQGMSLGELTHKDKIQIQFEDRDDIRTLPYQTLFEQIRSDSGKIGLKSNV